MQTVSKGSIQTSGRIGRTTRFEYANRQGRTVNPRTGKPYDFKNGVSGANSKTKQQQYPIKTRGAIFGGIEKIKTEPTLDPPPRACYNCWQKGHSRRNCPRPTVGRYCNNCGRRGEDLNTCPRCKYAHEIYIKQVQAKARGEELDPDEVEKLMLEPEFGEDEFDDEDDRDGCDEVLQELMLQDERTRIQNGRSNQGKRTGFQDRNDDDGYRKREWEREREKYGDILEKRYTDRREDDRRIKYSSKDTGYDDDVDRAGCRVQETTAAKQSTSSGTNMTADPVQDFLLLAKTIAHLPSETQDLIMRQVIAERKQNQLGLKTAKQDHEEDMWP